MDVTVDTIQAYFDQRGWSYQRLDDTHFQTGFRPQALDPFSIYITLAPNWVYFAISPFVQAPTEPECERKLYRHLLHLCQQINMAKFSVDTQGDVMLSVELPRANLDYSEFSDALDALSYYAEDTYTAVHSLATDPTAVSAFVEEQDLDWGE